MARLRRLSGLLLACLWLAAGAASGQETEDDDPEIGWSSTTDLSFVYTEGNSETDSLGLTAVARRRWKKGRLRIKLDAVQTNTADDPFLLVEPGLSWQPGEMPPADFETTVIFPGREPDVERYFAEGKYLRQIQDKLNWSSGASWDRNEDAGILNRFIAFGGLGHVWRDDDDFHFLTSYSLSYTDREEETPDPSKDNRFGGVRLSWDYMNDFGKHTTLDNDLTGNISLKDLSDYSMDMTTALSVTMSTHLKLKVSLQWLYNSEPALEDADIVANVELIDPDGIPGSGDELFVTVEEGGFEVELGEDQIRKKGLDTTFRTSLSIEF